MPQKGKYIKQFTITETKGKVKRVYKKEVGVVRAGAHRALNLHCKLNEEPLKPADQGQYCDHLYFKQVSSQPYGEGKAQSQSRNISLEAVEMFQELKDKQLKLGS